jgi:hypothetical protein
VITLRYDDAGLHADLTRAPQVTGLQLQKWMDRVVKHLVKAVQANIRKGDGLIGRRTGTLARAITGAVTTVATGQVVGDVWPDPTVAPYGSIQEDGGTIVPRTARMLTIPLAAMLTGNGVARGTARQLRDNPGAFGFTGTFVRHDVIFGKRGRAQIIPLFALKARVTIPAHRYLATTLTQEIVWIQDDLERATGEAVTLIFGDAEAA